MTTQKPSVGRVVHYVSYAGEDLTGPGGEELHSPASQHWAAIITQVGPHNTSPVCVAAFSPSGLHFEGGVQYDEAAAQGTWHWPGRVD